MPPNEDIGSDWELVETNGETIVTETHLEEHPDTESIHRTDIPDNQGLLLAKSEVVESTPTHGHALPICPNSSYGIETNHHRNVEVAPGAESTNGAITGNEPNDQSEVLVFKNIYTATGQFHINVQTKDGRRECSGEMSDLPVFMNKENAMGDNIPDDISVQQDHEHNHSTLMRPNILLSPAGSKPQALHGSRQISVNGSFPAGTTLEISTSDGTRQVISCAHRLHICNMSGGPGSIQFVGDEGGLSAFLKMQRNEK